MKFSFIIIDESDLDCFIARKVVESTDRTLGINTFQNAQTALEEITDAPVLDDDSLTIILLDLHMPIMDGFEFVEAFEKLPHHILSKYIIIVLSSTRNGNDIARILSYSCVSRIMEKPLTKDKLLSVLTQVRVNMYNKS